MNRHVPAGHGETPEHSPSLEDDVEPEDDDPYADVVNPLTGVVRLCARRCNTCIFHPGNLMHLQPGRVADMVAEARRAEGHVVCHETLGTDSPAICRGFADGPDQGRSLALRLARALGTLREVPPP